MYRWRIPRSCLYLRVTVPAIPLQPQLGSPPKYDGQSDHTVIYRRAGAIRFDFYSGNRLLSSAATPGHSDSVRFICRPRTDLCSSPTPVSRSSSSVFVLLARASDTRTVQLPVVLPSPVIRYPFKLETTRVS